MFCEGWGGGGGGGGVKCATSRVNRKASEAHLSTFCAALIGGAAVIKAGRDPRILRLIQMKSPLFDRV